MTMPADLSLMDFLFDKEDPMNQPDKDSFAKSDPWPCNTDDFLDSLLKFEDIPFEILDDNEMFTLPDDTIDMNVANSICSDSGLSSDQQFSPMVHDADDEDGTDFMASTSGSEGSPNPNFDAHLDSPIKEEEIEIDSSVYDLSDTETVGDVIIEDGHDIDDMNVLPDFDEDMTVEQVQSNSGQKLIRVTPVSGNPRSILLPVSMKDMKDIRAIKIFNSSRKSSSKPISSVTSSAGSSKSSSISSEDESDAHYPRLQLTSEEKRLLQKEGVRLPTHYPLTKFEERELKRIRRKIRNKISAQDSRKRKKEYIDGLEDRVKQCTEENMSLVKKIKVLQSQNQTMMTQLKRLHAALSRGTAKTAQPATCLMVLMLSVALVMMPNLGANRGATDIQAETEITLPENDIPPIAGRSRTLLFSKPIAEELCLAAETPELEELSAKSESRMMSEMDSLLHFRRRHHQDHDYGPAPKRAREPEPVEYLAGAKGFIVPPIDDDWPPPGGRLNNEIADKVVEYANEFKVNISDTRGTRTVVLQVPNEK